MRALGTCTRCDTRGYIATDNVIIVAILVAMNDTWSRLHPTSLIYPILTIGTILHVVRPNIVTRVGACHSACHRPSDAEEQSLSQDHTQQLHSCTTAFQIVGS